MRWFRRKPTWHERHPLPPGWRPRTRVNTAGLEVEPWGFLITDARGYELDGGERWLTVGCEADEAAYRILGHWLARQDFLEPHEIPGVRCSARRAIRYPGDQVGVAYAAEQALTA